MFGTHRSSANLLARRKRHSRRLWVLEGLEERVLLSPTLYTVNAITDTGAGSGTAGDLRYVINQANANLNTDGSLIQFDQTVFNSPQTITLSSPLILSETKGSEVINGPGADLVTVSGNTAVEVFQVKGGVTASLSGLTVSGGSAYLGGGIDNNGTLTAVNDTIANNVATGNGGGIYSNGTLTVINSTIANNLAYLGGGIDNNGTLAAVNDTIANNSATASGGGISNDSQGTLTVTNSTIANDSATYGGGIYNDGTLTVTNSTFASNSATSGGGAIYNNNTLTAVNDTIAYNTVASGYGGGLDVYGGTATLDNTIVALNTRAGTPNDISLSFGTVNTTNSDNNLIGTGGSGGLTNGVNGNLVGVTSPGLGTLASNGGPTQTMALLPGSPAIDAGDVSNAPATDQPRVLPAMPSPISGPTSIRPQPP